MGQGLNYEVRGITKEQKETLDKAIEIISKDKEVNGIVLGGSIAHGYSTPKSDVDIMIIVSGQEHQRRIEVADIQYCVGEYATYEGGYVDGKFISREFIGKVAEKGSEPARFAFCDAVVVHDTIGGLQDLVDKAGCYPIDKRSENIRRFLAQVEGWCWYYTEGHAKENEYLMGYSAYKMVLFATRLLLSVNSMLYPYHKWMFKALENAGTSPDGYIDLLKKISHKPNLEDIMKLNAMAREVAGEDAAQGWGNDFIKDIELTWLTGEACVEEM